MDVEDGNADDYEDTDDSSESEDDEETWEEMLRDDSRYKKLHTRDWLKEKVLKDVGKSVPLPKKEYVPSQKMRVNVCGKRIWNYASENAMSRHGWLQFSIIAKDCDLHHAIQLCRNWKEFSDLSLLTQWQYFPASNWSSWGGTRMTQQLMELEFYPYFMDFSAEQYTKHHQIAGRSKGRRQHDMVEAKNIIAGHMKRNDPVTRRFLHYLLMRTGEMLVLVRDGKTGRVITAPPEQYLWTFRRKEGLGRASKNEWTNILEVGHDYIDMTDELREWRFGFHDYYDVFIWDFPPGYSAIELYNTVITELRRAWRIEQPHDIYLHHKPLLQTLTRVKPTMRTRKIKEGEKVESIWDMVTAKNTEFRLFEIDGATVKTERPSNQVAQENPYLFYNKADAAEHAVLFPDDATRDKDSSVAFREFRNGASAIEGGILPSTIQHLSKGLAALKVGKDPTDAVHMKLHEAEDVMRVLPTILMTGLRELHQGRPSAEELRILKQTGLFNLHKAKVSIQGLESNDPMQLMERDRAVGFKNSFHAADLEPGATERYQETQEKISLMLRTIHIGSTDWIFFLADILNWLNLRADCTEYIQVPTAPWPHNFIAQDLVKAFAGTAMFFPEIETTGLVSKFLNSPLGKGFKDSVLFDPKKRSKTRPDVRTRTSYTFRDKKFWTEWDAFYKTKSYFTEVYPLDWNVAIRPIVAHLYRSGVLAPAYIQNDSQVVPGIATAMPGPHRPGVRDLFVKYHDPHGNFKPIFPPTFVPPDKWPKLVPLAQKFASAHPTARFALLRLWSAPHFYPYMVGLPSRQGTSFLDSVGRSWEWKFVPKDMPGSEFSAHHTVGARLEILKKQFAGRVVHRADLILVMGEDAADLLKYTTAVTFALQTKPWLREVDLWKSFINVGVDMLEDLEDFWVE